MKPVKTNGAGDHVLAEASVRVDVDATRRCAYVRERAGPSGEPTRNHLGYVGLQPPGY